MLQDIKCTNDNISLAKFSVIVDESTDVAIKSNLVIVIKYHSEITNTVKTKLLNLVEIKDKSVEGQFTILVNEISKHGMKMENLIRLSADATNVMFGEHNSIVQKIKSISPDCSLSRPNP